MSQPREFPRFLDEWREVNGEDFTPLDYLTQPEAVTFVIASQWLFVPDLVEYRGGVFKVQQPRGFTERKRAILDDWFDHLEGDTPAVERISNQVTLWDQFGASDLESLDMDLDQLAASIGRAWEGVLKVQFPGREFIVEVRDGDEGTYGPQVTFFSAPGGFGPHGGPLSAS